MYIMKVSDLIGSMQILWQIQGLNNLVSKQPVYSNFLRNHTIKTVQAQFEGNLILL